MTPVDVGDDPTVISKAPVPGPVTMEGDVPNPDAMLGTVEETRRVLSSRMFPRKFAPVPVTRTLSVAVPALSAQIETSPDVSAQIPAFTSFLFGIRTGTEEDALNP